MKRLLIGCITCLAGLAGFAAGAPPHAGAQTGPAARLVAQAQAPADQTEAERFVVYFASGSAKLDAAAEAVLLEAKAALAKLERGRVLLIAGADTVGDPTANVRLSERRADAVAAAMIAGGVAPSSIRAEAFGEADLADPTEDAVDQAGNRRVEILVGR